MQKNIFKDHFSKQADSYQAYRPTYPGELFKYLTSVAPSNRLAWDCATGSGQAALALAYFYDQIIATDASETQMRNTTQHEKIDYIIATAENSNIKNNSVDLITIAQALHWFETDVFFTEAKRVLKNNGIIAAWTYNLFRLEPEINSIIDHFDQNIIGEFWPDERKLVDNGYASIEFPFKRIKAPRFKMTTRWSLPHVLGYLETWSAVQRYKEINNLNPLETITEDLSLAWGDPQIKKEIDWPLTLIAGRHKTNKP